MSSATFAPSVQSRSFVAEVDGALRRVDAHADEAGEAPLGARGPLDALIVELEVRVLALPDAEGGRDARERAGRERAFELERRAARPAPRQRHRQPLASPQQVDRADPSAVGEAIAVVVAEDRQEHQLALHARPAPRRRSLVYRFRREARTLVHDEDERDVRRALERAIALADLDGLEVAAGLQPLFDVAQPGRGKRLTECHARQHG